MTDMIADKKNVSFVVMFTEESPDRFLLIRNVNDYSTHYLGPDGMWIAFPEADDDLAQMFENLKDPANLPRLENWTDDDLDEIETEGE